MRVFDRRRHFAATAADMRRAHETLEKLNHPHDARVFAALALLPEVAALLEEAAGAPEGDRPATRVEHLAR